MKHSMNQRILHIFELPFAHTTNYFTEETLNLLGSKESFYRRSNLLSPKELLPVIDENEGGVAFHLSPEKGSQVVLYRFNCLVGESAENLIDSVLLFYRAEIGGSHFAVAEIQQVGINLRNSKPIVSLFPISGNLDESMTEVYASEILTRMKIDSNSNFKSLVY